MIQIKAQAQPWSQSIGLLVFTHFEGVFSVAQPMTFSVLADPYSVTEPTLKISRTAAQSLMDELWACGLRPTEGSGSAGSLAATERHLRDMQAVAMGLLRKDGVQLP